MMWTEIVDINTVSFRNGLVWFKHTHRDHDAASSFGKDDKASRSEERGMKREKERILGNYSKIAICVIS
jgi:hypothetical protein